MDSELQKSEASKANQEESDRDVSLKDALIVLFVMLLWLYSVVLMFRAWSRILNPSSCKMVADNEKSSALWKWGLDKILDKEQESGLLKEVEENHIASIEESGEEREDQLPFQYVPNLQIVRHFSLQSLPVATRPKPFKRDLLPRQPNSAYAALERRPQMCPPQISITTDSDVEVFLDGTENNNELVTTVSIP